MFLASRFALAGWLTLAVSGMACAKIAGLDGYRIGDGDSPAQPEQPDETTGGDDDVEPDDEPPGREPEERDGDVDEVTACLPRLPGVDPKWILRGVAGRDAGAIELTPEAASQVGQVYWDEVLTFASFEVTFGFKILNGDAMPADGIAFAWIEGAAMPALGIGGGELGIKGARGFAVVVDTYQNPVDPVGPDVSLRSVETFGRIASSAAVPALLDEKEHTMTVQLAGTSLKVLLDGTQVLTTTMPNGYEPIVGRASFSAGTGSAMSTHTLTQVRMRVGKREPCAR